MISASALDAFAGLGALLRPESAAVFRCEWGAGAGALPESVNQAAKCTLNIHINMNSCLFILFIQAGYSNSLVILNQYVTG